MGDVSLTWVPNGALSTDGSGGSCNGYLPNDTTLSRFLWVRSHEPHPRYAELSILC